MAYTLFILQYVSIHFNLIFYFSYFSYILTIIIYNEFMYSNNNTKTLYYN